MILIRVNEQIASSAASKGFKNLHLIRRLTVDDEPVLRALCEEAPEFDIDDRTRPLKSLEAPDAATFLGHPNILFWVAEKCGRVDGFLFCYVQQMWHPPPRELMLYEIGVRATQRRRGVGRALMQEMTNWMRDNSINDIWVLADNPGAEAFYLACGFQRDAEQPVMLSRSVETPDRSG